MANINGLTYGVTFGEKHSITDWGLYLSSRPVIAPPEAKTTYIDIPGASGSLDLTEALGGVFYETRKGEFSFLMTQARDKWLPLYNEILGYLHGQRLKVILDELPSYYYLGRLAVASYTPGDSTAKLKITGVFDPYKYKVADDTEDGI